MEQLSKPVAGWLWRAAMLGLTAGLYWLQTNFIPRAEFLAEKEGALKQYQVDKQAWWDQLTKMNTSINDLAVSIRLFDANKTVINDHEARIRALERQDRITNPR